MTLDPVLLVELVAAVQQALEEEATRRAGAGRPQLDRDAQEALAVRRAAPRVPAGG